MATDQRRLVQTAWGSGPPDGWMIVGERPMGEVHFGYTLDLGLAEIYFDKGAPWLPAWETLQDILLKSLDCPLSRVTWWMQPYYWREENP